MSEGEGVMTENTSQESIDLDLTRVTDPQETMDLLAARLSGWLYIEDSSGRLLMSSGNVTPDHWRHDPTPFSAPAHPRRIALLSQWRDRIRVYEPYPVHLGLEEYRLLLTLTYLGEPFALVHIVSREPRAVLTLQQGPEHVKTIGDKLYIVLMGAMNAIRRQCLVSADATDLVQEREETASRFRAELRDVIPQFQSITVRFGEIDSAQFHHEVIDYASLMVWHARALSRLAVSGTSDGSITALGSSVSGEATAEAEPVAPLNRVPGYDRDSLTGGIDLSVIHRRVDLLQAVLIATYIGAEPAESTAFISGLTNTIRRLSWSVTAAVGPRYADAAETPDRVQQTARIHDLGEKRDAKGPVLTQQDIGLAAFVLPLTQSPELREFSGDLLDGLHRKDPTLLETLRAYLEMDGNATRTAEFFAVDRRTITYRLNRIGEELGLDLALLENRVFLYLALRAADAR